MPLRLMGAHLSSYKAVWLQTGVTSKPANHTMGPSRTETCVSSGAYTHRRWSARGDVSTEGVVFPVCASLKITF